MSEKKLEFDPTKPVQCRNGSPARVVAYDVHGGGEYPLLVLITSDDGKEEAKPYTKDGRLTKDAEEENPLDLVNVIVAHEMYINYLGGGMMSWEFVSQEAANSAPVANLRQALIKITRSEVNGEIIDVELMQQHKSRVPRSSKKVVLSSR